MKPFTLNALLATSLLSMYPLVRCEDHASLNIATREFRAPIHARDFAIAVKKREATLDASTVGIGNGIVDTLEPDVDNLHARSDIGSTIYHRRAVLGLSQAALAAACHLPRSTIAGIENGQIHPSLTILASIGNVLGIRLY